ncbi:NlpC/P60 family protein [Psychromonas ossibalaenae]|uniref:NlpC/P60 family protein n=1 Tax=Psychromonas ossibalaenae TaxID=444922 RepID=UPI000368DFFB|nr:NlpC/P60 family protein [Psychromonas ossibalaenae]
MIKINLKAVCLLFFTLIFISACSTTPSSNSRSSGGSGNKLSQKENEQFIRLLHSEHQDWKGTPYRLGGSSKKGIDCSALMQIIYKNSFDINIARTTKVQANSGIFVNEKDLQAGDLVFFKTSWKVRHVGIYIVDRQFLHASTSRGVMISSLDNIYWKSNYWQARRLID